MQRTPPGCVDSIFKMRLDKWLVLRTVLILLHAYNIYYVTYFNQN